MGVGGGLGGGGNAKKKKKRPVRLLGTHWEITHVCRTNVKDGLRLWRCCDEDGVGGVADRLHDVGGHVLKGGNH